MPAAEIDHFEQFLGLVLTEVSAERVEGQITVGAAQLAPSGTVHGGILAALAESVATAGTRCGVSPAAAAIGLSNFTTAIHPVREGILHARALCRHAGRTTWVWEVEINDASGRLCAFSRATIAIR